MALPSCGDGCTQQYRAWRGCRRWKPLQASCEELVRAKTIKKMMVSVTTRIYDDDFSIMIFKDELWTPYRARCRWWSPGTAARPPGESSDPGGKRSSGVRGTDHKQDNVQNIVQYNNQDNKRPTKTLLCERIVIGNLFVKGKKCKDFVRQVSMEVDDMKYRTGTNNKYIYRTRH